MSSFIRNIRSYFVFDKRSKLSSGANTNKKVIFQKLKTTKVIDDRWRFLFFVANGEIDTNLAYLASKSIILMLANLELTWQKKKLKRFASVGPSALPYSALDEIFNGLIIDCNFPEMTTFLPLFCISMSKHSRRYREFVVTSRAERKRIRFPFSDRPAWAVLLKLLLFSCQLFQFGLFSRSANNNNKLFFC